jgi:hypothetical protein
VPANEASPAHTAGPGNKLPEATAPRADQLSASRAAAAVDSSRAPLNSSYTVALLIKIIENQQLYLKKNKQFNKFKINFKIQN